MTYRVSMFSNGIKKLLGGGLFKAGSVKGFFAGIVAVFQLLGAIIFDTPVTPYGHQFNYDEWECTWSDEFDGDALNASYWSGNNKGMRRGGYWDPDSQVSVKDGKLYITTEYLEDGKYGPGWYTAEIETRDKIAPTYGYIECRCICAPGNGLWSAFWTFSHGVGKIDGTGRDGAEIDIFESPHYAYNSIFKDSVTHSVHYDGYAESHQRKFLGSWYVDNPYTEFNTYGVEWNENELIFYINGIESARIDDESVPRVEEWLKLSVEVNGTNGVPGLTNDGTIDGGKIGLITDNGGNDYKSDFVVDYVRIYQKKPVTSVAG